MNPLHSLIPREASSISHEVDAITFGLVLCCGAIIFLVFGLLFAFCVLYRKNSKHSRKIIRTEQTWLEFGWTFATLGIFIFLFFWGSLPYLKMHVVPPDAEEISVVAKQWMWKFQHPDGIREIDKLHVPVGKTILLTMTSQDVIHSFFVPDFRVKQDVLPGRYSRVWFKATEPGVYHLYCTQYCGTFHADMRGEVIAMPPQDYQHWLQTGLEETHGPTMASRGRELFTRMGCISCHGIHPGMTAPALEGVFGKKVGLSDGTQVIADENYIRESIMNPSAKIVQGYQNIMPDFSASLSEEDVLALVAFVKYLGGTPQSQAPEGTGP